MAKTTKPAAGKSAARKAAPATSAVRKKPAARPAPKAAADPGLRVKEFAAIQRKAKAVGAKPSAEHFDAAGNPTGEWAGVLAEARRMGKEIQGPLPLPGARHKR